MAFQDNEDIKEWTFVTEESLEVVAGGAQSLGRGCPADVFAPFNDRRGFGR